MFRDSTTAKERAEEFHNDDAQLPISGRGVSVSN